MHMKKSLLLVAILGLILCGSAQAQTLASNTTLSAAITSTQTVITVGSNSGFTVGNLAIVDAEVMQIRAISGTTITVLRGQNGTRSTSHANSSVIQTGGINHFKMYDPDWSGNCIRGSGQATYLPWFNQTDGTYWNCRMTSASVGTWNGTRTKKITDNSAQTGAP